MEWSDEVARTVEVCIERFGTFYGFIEECVSQAIGLPWSLSYALMWNEPLRTSCWAAAARLQNALVTSSELHALDAIFSSICAAVLSVISNSFGENHPDS